MPSITIVGADTVFTLSPGSKLTELEPQQNTLPFGCCSAACGTCAIEVVAGMEHLNSKSEEENDVLDNMGENGPNRRLACQCQVTGDVTLLPLG